MCAPFVFSVKKAEETPNGVLSCAAFVLQNFLLSFQRTPPCFCAPIAKGRGLGRVPLLLVPEAGVATATTVAYTPSVGEKAPPEPFLPQTAFAPSCSPPRHVKSEKRPKALLAFWCRKRGSNPHGIATTGF